MPDAASSSRRRFRPSLSAALVLAGLGLVGSGAVLLTAELTRAPTAAERADLAAREHDERWRLRAPEELFPAVVLYGGDARGEGAQEGHRVGIAPVASCTDGLEAKAAAALAAHGCTVVLRAAYLDATRSEITTVGVVPLRDADAARAAGEDLRRPGADGVRAAGFPGTAVARFTGARTQVRTVAEAGRYLVLRASGWTDGRPVLPSKTVTAWFAQGAVLADVVTRVLSAEADPICSVPGVRC